MDTGINRVGVYASAAALVAVLPVVAGISTASSAASDSAATFDAPGAGPGAKITVTKTSNLRNETVGVSWRGFRPSSSDQLQNGGGSFDVNTTNPVRIYQCRGDSRDVPRDARDCYGASGFRGTPASGNQPAIPAVPGFTYPGQTDEFQNLPDGPANFQDTVTTAAGSGQATIQLFTKRESPALGCEHGVACSIVVVPNYGRPQGATEDQLDAPWAWENRTVIPLDFAPIDPACSGNAIRANVEGSPLSARALASWRAASCTATNKPVDINYTSLDDNQARADVAAGQTDVGLASRPATDDLNKNLVYAPVAASGLVIAFQIDDAHGRPVTSMRLNQRLVAKIITASYRVADNPGVAGNPKNLFRDPEFLDLNPGIDWPSGAPGNHPLLLAELSDLTWTLTNWIQSDKQAMAFLKGEPDPWGMHVNTAYKNLALPIERFAVLDEKQSDSFEPIQGLDHVAQNVSLAQFPGAISSVEDGITIVSKPPRQNPGRREVIGIIDAASAQAFRLSTASLRNGSGQFVAPTDASLAAGISAMRPNSDGVTRTVAHTVKNTRAYPLTITTNAIVRVGIKGQKKEAVLRFLDYSIDQGQRGGTRAGNLPPGYVPLSGDLIKLNRAARAAVAAGVAVGNGNPSPNSGETGEGNSSDGYSSDSGSVDGATAGAAGNSGAAVAAKSPDGATQGILEALTDPKVLSWLVPVVMLVGIIAALAGPTLVYLNQKGRLPTWLRR